MNDENGLIGTGPGWRVRCNGCAAEFTILQAIGLAFQSSPQHSWIAFRCWVCGSSNHLKVVPGSISEGSLDGIPGPCLIITNVIPIPGLEVLPSRDGITINFQNREWFISSGSFESCKTGDECSQLGLDDDHGFLHKLGQFLAVLVVGPLIGLLLLAALMQPMTPVWKYIAHAIVETLVVFWILLLVFIWWRPSWLRHIYASTERKVIFIACLASLVCFFAIGFEILVGWLRQMKIL
jgi:hypothetical protein